MSDVVGRSQIFPVELRRDQMLEVELNREGRFVAVRELMPPLTNYERLRGIDEAHEKALRDAEWAALESKAFV